MKSKPNNINIPSYKDLPKPDFDFNYEQSLLKEMTDDLIEKYDERLKSANIRSTIAIAIAIASLICSVLAYYLS